MPPRKAKKGKKKPIKKKIAKKKVKKVVKKKVKKVAKKKPAKKAKKAVKKAPKKATKKQKVLGKISHYYDRIGVAVVDVESIIKIGDRVLIKRGKKELKQKIASLQSNRVPIKSAQPGETVGLKVDAVVERGATIFAS